MSELEAAIAPLAINETTTKEKEAVALESKKEKPSPKKEKASPQKEAPKKEAVTLKARCIVQQCTSATLQTKLADPETGTDSESVQVV